MEARGFTVLELITSLGLIATLAALGLWRATAWLPELRLEGAARQVVLDLRQARARAMAEQQQRRLVFSPIGDSYRQQRRVAGSYEDEGPPIGLPSGIDLADCTAAGAAVAFAPRGTASTFGTIILRNSGGRERRVIVDIVGRVRVQ
jgi:type II secretory pathway pseudopilin PulG